MNARCRMRRPRAQSHAKARPMALAAIRDHSPLIVGALLALLCFLAFTARSEQGQITAVAPSARSLALTFSSSSSAPAIKTKNAPNFAALPAASRFEVGKPDLPIYGQWVLIPNGTTLSLRITAGTPQVIDNIDIEPLQPPETDFWGAGPEPYRQDLLTYATDADYPGVLAEAEAPATVRGQDCTVVWLYPYQYNPVQRQLTVYEDMSIEVVFDGAIEPVPVNLRNETFAAMWRRLAVNADTVLAAQREAASATAASAPALKSGFESDGDGSTGGCDYLIVTHPDFETAADTLAAWKRLSGFRTKVVDTTTTGATASDIETYIDASQAWSPAPSYVLLVGDAEFIPTFYVLTHASDASTQAGTGLMQGKVASDRYYADTNGDIYSDLYIGRLPVDTIAEANSAVNRIISYERTPPDPVTYASFYTQATICAYFQDEDTNGYADRRFAKTSEDIYQYLTAAAGFTAERIYYTPGGVTPTNWYNGAYYSFENDTAGAALPAYLQKPTFAWDGGTSDITAAVNAGAFFLTHRDHGSRRMYTVPPAYWFAGGWADPEFRPTDAAALTNGALTPVVWSLNCQTGWFDNETDDATYEYYQAGSIFLYFEARDADESFCEQFIINANGGGVGVIGATRVSYSGINDRLAWGWMDATWPGFIEYHSGSYGDSTALYQMGPVFEYGKNYMLTKYFLDNYVRTGIDEYVWFGDPTMEMRTGVPQSLSVTHPATITVSTATDVEVAVSQGGSDLSGARVTISRAATPDDYWTDTTDASGLVTFSGLTTSAEGDYDIVVTAHDSLPYEGTITSQAIVVSLTVTAPNGGEAWARRTSQDITWTSSNVTGNVSIDLYKGAVFSRTLTNTVAASAGTWTWAIPDSETIASDYQIRVVSMEDGGVYDDSDATFSITANAAPTANDDGFAVDEGATLNIGAPGVLDDDTDAEDDSLTAVLVSDPAHGALTLNANGSFTYIHDGSDTTTDSFTYKANDGGSDSNVATVTITINPQNDAPEAVADAYSLDEGDTLDVAAPGVLDNDTDIEDDTLNAVLLAPPSYGDLTLNADGSFTYVHDGSEASGDSFLYYANDGQANSNFTIVVLTINPRNDVPVANDDAYSVDEGDTLDVAGPGVLDNDADAEDDALAALLVTAPDHGSLTLNAGGSFTYTHDGSETTSDSFTYQANDGTDDSNVATVSITINSLNDPPAASDDAYAVDEGDTLEVVAPGVLDNDTDAEDDALTAVLATAPTHGSLTLNADGSFTYTHDGSETTSDSFTYQANDGANDSNVATVSITINPLNDAPAASDDAYAVDEGDTLEVLAPGVLDNDTDAEDDPLTAVPVTAPTHGTLTLNADGSFSYTHDGSETTSDSFTYRANDGADDSNVATVSIAVNPLNDAPIANDDTYAVDEGDTLDVSARGVLDNDTDAEGPLTSVLITGPAHGSLTLNADGSFIYTHDGSETTSDSFAYRANDGPDDSNVAAVSITINPLNDAPVADDDAYAVDEGDTLDVPAPGVLDNDTDAEGDSLTSSLVAGPAHGTLTLNADGSFTYTHDGSETTSDSFTYQANDGADDSNTATVAITVNPVQDGDVNRDDAVNALDVQMVINQALGIPTGHNCDIDCNGSTNAVDVQLAINAALGV